MTTKIILERLQTLDLPFAYREFRDTKKNPAPDPPFIVWLKSEQGRGADSKNNLLEVSMSIELYTVLDDDALTAVENNQRREQLEMQLESVVLPDVEYQYFIAPIPSEQMMQTAYEIKFLQKGSAR